MARDLHGSIGHAVNVISIQAGAGRCSSTTTPALPRRARGDQGHHRAAPAEELDGLVARAARRRGRADHAARRSGPIAGFIRAPRAPTWTSP